LLQLVEALRALPQTLSGVLLLQALADPYQTFAEALHLPSQTFVQFAIERA